MRWGLSGRAENRRLRESLGSPIEYPPRHRAISDLSSTRVTCSSAPSTWRATQTRPIRQSATPDPQSIVFQAAPMLALGYSHYLVYRRQVFPQVLRSRR